MYYVNVLSNATSWTLPPGIVDADVGDFNSSTTMLQQVDSPPVFVSPSDALIAAAEKEYMVSGGSAKLGKLRSEVAAAEAESTLAQYERRKKPKQVRLFSVIFLLVAASTSKANMTRSLAILAGPQRRAKTRAAAEHSHAAAAATASRTPPPSTNDDLRCRHQRRATSSS